MIFRTTDEIKKFLPISINFEFDEISRFIKQVERDILVPAISQAQFDDINTTYTSNESSLTTNQKNLLELMREVIAPLAFLKWIPFGQVQIDSAGIRIASTPEKKTAFQWQINELEKSAAASGFNALEALLDYLETNIATYTIYGASSAHTDTKSFFVTNAKDFTKFFNINNSRLFYNSVKGQMRKIEDFFIKGTIGSALCATMKTQLAGSGLDANNLKLIDFVKGAIVNFTMNRVIIEKAVILDENGINASYRGTMPQERDRVQVPDNTLDALMTTTGEDGQNYLNQLKNYLNANATASVYADYYNSGLYIDPTAVPKDLNGTDTTAQGIVGMF